MPNNQVFDEFPEIKGEGSPQEARHASPKPASSEQDPAADPFVEMPQNNRLLALWEGLSRAGLGEMAFRTGTQLLSVALVLGAIWIMRSLYLNLQHREAAQALAASAPTETPLAEMVTIQLPLPPLQDLNLSFGAGIPRNAQMHTIIPTRPRTEIITYTVQQGDTIFGIAEIYNLQPETIFWGNQDTLWDDPHRMQPGIVLRILPTDGVYHKWSAGEGLNGVAEFYGVKAEDIVNWPGNHLDPATVGDYRAPNIEAGTMLMVPGGRRSFVSWSGPLNLTRKNPAVAKSYGPGYCGTIMDGAVGNGTFVWPTDLHMVTGYDYSPATNHLGVDIGGGLGVPIYAIDAGVAVYAGWNDRGYGNLIILDHGNGWQSLYAHLDTYYLECGQSIYQGSALGTMGTTGNSTGPHLHFEMINSNLGKVDPKQWLP
ncbi:MAG: LysM peptidoglycan-binding domain-containing M23 family metallopeptidase [Chloroflexota bacterium]